MILFARTRHHYDSYRDFWALVDLAGFPIVYVDEVDLTARNVYVTTMVNGEWTEMLRRQEKRRRMAHLVLWNLERPAGWAGTVGGYNEKIWSMIHDRQFDEHWVSDRRLAEESETRFVVLGSHPGLGEPSPVERRVKSFVHMSALVNRRQSVFKHFDGLDIAPNGWGEVKRESLQTARFAFNVHQDGHPFQEPLRFALFAAYGLPILTEAIYDSYPWGAETMLYDHYPSLVDRMKSILSERSYQRYHDMGLKAREMMTVKFEFGKTVRQAVYESVGER